MRITWPYLRRFVIGQRSRAVRAETAEAPPQHQHLGLACIVEIVVGRMAEGLLPTLSVDPDQIGAEATVAWGWLISLRKDLRNLGTICVWFCGFPF